MWNEALRQQIYLGDEAFVERMREIADPKRKAAREIPKAQRRATRSLAQWLSTCDSREEALFRAHTQSGLTMSAIARELGLSVSRVSRRFGLSISLTLSSKKTPNVEAKRRAALWRVRLSVWLAALCPQPLPESLDGAPIL